MTALDGCQSRDDRAASCCENRFPQGKGAFFCSVPDASVGQYYVNYDAFLMLYDASYNSCKIHQVTNQFAQMYNCFENMNTDLSAYQI